MLAAAAARRCGRRFIVAHGRGRAIPAGPRLPLRPRPPGRAHGPCAPGRARAGEGRHAVRGRALQRGRPVPSTPAREIAVGSIGGPNPCLKPGEAWGARVARGGAQRGAARGPRLTGAAGPRGPGTGSCPSGPCQRDGFVQVGLASPASRHLACRFPWRGCVYRPEPQLAARGARKAMPTSSGASQSPSGCSRCQEGEGVRLHPHNQKCVTENWPG